MKTCEVKYIDAELAQKISFRDIGAAATSHGPICAGYVDGAPVFVCGIVIPWEHFGEAWIIPHPEFREHPSAVLETRKLIRSLAEQFQLRRIQGVAAEQINERFMEWLGFHREAYLEDFTADGRGVWLMRWKA